MQQLITILGLVEAIPFIISGNKISLYAPNNDRNSYSIGVGGNKVNGESWGDSIVYNTNMVHNFAIQNNPIMSVANYGVNLLGWTITKNGSGDLVFTAPNQNKIVFGSNGDLMVKNTNNFSKFT